MSSCEILRHRKNTGSFLFRIFQISKLRPRQEKYLVDCHRGGWWQRYMKKTLFRGMNG